MVSDDGDEAFPYFSNGSGEQAIESKISEEDGESKDPQRFHSITIEDSNDVQFAYPDSTWLKLHFSYDL